MLYGRDLGKIPGRASDIDCPFDLPSASRWNLRRSANVRRPLQALQRRAILDAFDIVTCAPTLIDFDWDDRDLERFVRPQRRAGPLEGDDG